MTFIYLLLSAAVPCKARTRFRTRSSVFASRASSIIRHTLILLRQTIYACDGKLLKNAAQVRGMAIAKMAMTLAEDADQCSDKKVMHDKL
jgi:hypothetical protein